MSESILHRVASGVPGAVQECIDRYGGLVWSLARRLCGTDGDAEDAVQEIFVELWRSAERFDPAVASETTFVAMIARRRLIDRRRRLGRMPGFESISEPAAVTDGQDERIDAVEEATRAASALTRLSAEQQRVLRLSIYDGLSHEQISRSTGLPLGTVKTHIRRGLIKVRELLEGASASGASAPDTPPSGTEVRP